jgi:6-phosphogluconate dehydrogenase
MSAISFILISNESGVLTSALYARFRSRQEHTFGEKMLSATRFGFGGHICESAPN